MKKINFNHFSFNFINKKKDNNVLDKSNNKAIQLYIQINIEIHCQ